VPRVSRRSTRRTPSSRPDSLAAVRSRVEGARVARLATVDAAGKPHLVPICFVLAGETLYSAVDSKPKRSLRLKRLENVRANPCVEVLVDHYEDDWSRLWWVRLQGLARVLTEGEDRDRALALLAQKYPQYRDEPPPGPVLAVDVDGWKAWRP
jgi:PPOX class probable F420-dependent enzyme